MSSTGEGGAGYVGGANGATESDPDVPAQGSAIEPALSVTDLTKRYGDTVALEDVNLVVEDGEFVSIVGPSGCGKSTLLRVLSGLEPTFEGGAAVDGTDVRDGGSDGVGMVFQEPRLLPWADVRDNIAVGLPSDVDTDDPDACERIGDLIDAVGLERFGSSYPAELSGGMAQRVSLARGLAYEPSVLLLDEPFSALDQLTTYEQQDNLLEVYAERSPTVVLVTHDIEEAAYLSDRVVVLGDEPGSIDRVIGVDAARPRDRTDDELVRVKSVIADALGV